MITKSKYKNVKEAVNIIREYYYEKKHWSEDEKNNF